MRSRVTALVVALATVGGTTGAAIATAPKDHGKQPAPQQHSASHHQYKPGKGCGDKNHHHERENECKKRHHGHSDEHGHGRSDEHGHGHSDEHGHGHSNEHGHG